jgi:hypothetical protein
MGTEMGTWTTENDADTGMTYTLYREMAGVTGAVKVFDDDSGNVAMLVKYPTFEAAEAAFNKAVG